MQLIENTDLACPVCGLTEFKHRFNKKGREFWQCKSCAMELQHPLPTPGELKEYYDASYTEGMYTEFAAAQTMKQMTAQRRLFEIRRHIPIRGDWLDVGCADGTFVKIANENGVNGSGVELSQVAVDLAVQRGLNVQCGTLESLSDQTSFDTLTAFDVLEHVLEPVEFIRGLRSRIRDGGHVVLTLPDLDSIARRLMGSRWYFYVPEEHLHFFNRKNLGRLLRKEGFEVTAASRTYKPLNFDYSLVQFAEYNPMIYRTLNALGKALPSQLRSKVIPLPIGEMMLIAKRTDTPTTPRYPK
ncbi:class I SAM-dependent methyltransferase [Rubripirellula obstinata]|nr:class I SAM-dependent methyltransferase [Rubripirellula obstinata]